MSGLMSLHEVSMCLSMGVGRRFGSPCLVLCLFMRSLWGRLLGLGAHRVSVCLIMCVFMMSLCVWTWALLVRARACLCVSDQCLHNVSACLIMCVVMSLCVCAWVRWWGWSRIVFCVSDHSPNRFTCGGSFIEKKNPDKAVGARGRVGRASCLNVSLWFCGVAGLAAWGWAWVASLCFFCVSLHVFLHIVLSVHADDIPRANEKCTIWACTSYCCPKAFSKTQNSFVLLHQQNPLAEGARFLHE